MADRDTDRTPEELARMVEHMGYTPGFCAPVGGVGNRDYPVWAPMTAWVRIKKPKGEKS